MNRRYWTNGLATLYQADARAIPLEDGSVHCVCTSPPYWMQRVYQGNDERGIGLEDSVEAWIENLLDVFREVKRVLRDDGLVWVNLGESRNSGGQGYGTGSKGLASFPVCDCTCHRPSGAQRASRPESRTNSKNIRLAGESDPLIPATTREHSGHLPLPDSSGSTCPDDHISSILRQGQPWLVGAQPLVSQESMLDVFSAESQLNEPSQLLGIGAPEVSDSSFDDVQESAHRMGSPCENHSFSGATGDQDSDISYKSGTADALDPHKLGKACDSCSYRHYTTVSRHPLNKLAIPERFALAMQADGWIWRDTVIWHKKSPMPESLSGTRWERCRVKGTQVRGRKTQSFASGSGRNDGDNPGGGLDQLPWAQWSDCPGCPKCSHNDGYVLRRGSWRCTNAYEYVFMFAKGPGYWCDGEAVKTGYTRDWWTERRGPDYMTADEGRNDGGKPKRNEEGSGANRRNVWSDISSEPFGGQHFATFPPGLPTLCIQASTSDRGVCPGCGSQWARVVESGTTIGWRPTCTCPPHEPVPATVLDPFAGTATTLLAAQRLGRRSYGTDISAEYLDMAIQRLSKEAMPTMRMI
jgi:hypothetical protein